MASNTRRTWKRRVRKHVNMGKKRKADGEQALDAAAPTSCSRGSASPASRPTGRQVARAPGAAGLLDARTQLRDRRTIDPDSAP